ncbi:MAG: hypothetical protein IJJ13_00395 [Lachnospiraceae bacterium]|nr:hypothetical protein [Lachnospiraceae bacterium]
MNMIEITKENAADFQELLGEDLVSDMSRNFFKGLAATDDGDKCHGVLVYELLEVDSEEDTKSRIRLLKGDSEEIKAGLQDEYRKAVSESDVETSFFETSEKDMASFFEKIGFSNATGESKELSITVADLAKLPVKRNAKLPDYIQGLTDVSVIQYRNFVKKTLIRGNKGAVEDLAYLPLNWFEREASSCSISDDKIDGVMLIRKTPSGELHPLLYTAFGPDFAKSLGFMLTRTVNYALDNYPPETRIVIYRHNKKVLELTHKLLTGHKGEDVITGTRNE